MTHLRCLLLAMTMIFCSISNAIGFQGSTIQNGGTYYLYNLYQAKFLAAGNSWGTQASLDNNAPLLCTLSASNPGYIIKTGFNGNANHALYINGGKVWVDSDGNGTATVWTLTAVDEGYTIGNGSSLLLFDSGTACSLESATTDLNKDKAIWKLVSKTEYEEYVAKKRFTVAALNVDGMPKEISVMGVKISLNPDAKEAAGATAIGQKLKTMGWDVIGVSEDFNFHSEIWNEAWNDGVDGTSVYSYNATTHQEEITVGNANITNYTSKKPLFDTDGLCLFYKKSNVSQSMLESSERITNWTTHYGYTGDGADGLITKGYRYYTVQLNDGTEFDLYILHMDAEDSESDNAAREVQVKQLVDAIKATDNKRPIIVMGDTNCRYTRDRLKHLFIDGINADERFIVADVWVENGRQGVYPTYGSGTLSQTDLGYRRGEVVDKVFYINNKDCSIRINPVRFASDLSFINNDGEPLADHWPAVCEFEYHDYDASVDDKPEEVNLNGTYYLRNKETGAFLKAGGWWGTHAVQGTYGRAMTFQKLANGKYDISGLTQDDPYMDGSGAQWNVVQNGIFYSLTYVSGGVTKALTANDPTTFPATPGPNTRYVTCANYNASDNYQQWQLLTESDLKAEMMDGTETSPYNCTFLLHGANFDSNDNEVSSWQGFPTDATRMSSNKSNGTVNIERGNPCAEVYVSNCTKTHLGNCDHGTTWEVSQAFTGIPNGRYRISCQAYHRVNYDKSASAEIYLYGRGATEEKINVPVMYDEKSVTSSTFGGTTEQDGYYYPNSMAEATLYFNAGYYKTSVEVTVNNGTLTVALGKTSDTGASNSCWACFDNFQIHYLGKVKVDEKEEEEEEEETNEEAVPGAEFTAMVYAQQRMQDNKTPQYLVTSTSVDGVSASTEKADISSHLTTLSIDCSAISGTIESVSVFANSKAAIAGPLSFNGTNVNMSAGTAPSIYASNDQSDVITVVGSDKKCKAYLLPATLSGGVKVTVRTTDGKFYTQNFTSYIAAGAKKELTVTQTTANQLWMSTIPGNTYFSFVSTPGAHDAATSGVTNYSDMSKCQNEDIATLLANGVRAFDVRPGYYYTSGITTDNLYIYHGQVSTNVKYVDAISTLVDFVKNNPSEAISVIMVKENCKPTLDLFGKWTDRSSEMWAVMNACHSEHSAYMKLLDHSYYTLDDFRGKICFINRNGTDCTNTTRITNWPDNGNITNYSAAIGGTCFANIQDKYNTNGTDKQNEIKSMLETSSKNTEKKNFHYNFCSSANSPASYASATNPVITTYLNAGSISGPTGYVYADFIGSSSNGGAALLAAIINQNYRYVYNGRFFQYTPGDVNNDGKIDIADCQMLESLILQKECIGAIRKAADINADGKITVADLTELINLLK